jgi:uncharacterized protein involved in outer membrane biogenesis
MKKPLKALRIILLVILILLLTVVILINFFADSATKAAIESAGTKALNVGVTVQDVDLSIIGGKIGLQNLMIDNPPGYQQQKLLELNDAEVTVQAKSLLGDTVRIEEIKLDGVTLVVEQKGLSNNLQDLIKSMPKQESPSGKKLHIDILEITNITANVKLLPLPGKADVVTLKLPAIKMDNLGNDNKLDLAALTGQIILAIARGIVEQGPDILPKDMINTMTSTLSKALDLSKDIFGEGKGTGEKVLKDTEDIGKGITEGLKDLLKKEKK